MTGCPMELNTCDRQTSIEFEQRGIRVAGAVNVCRDKFCSNLAECDTISAKPHHAIDILHGRYGADQRQTGCG